MDVRLPALLLLAACLPAKAAASPDLDAGVFASLPPALNTGQTVGPTLGAAWAVAGPLRLGARAGVGWAAESNLTYRLEHTELRAAASVAVAWPVGRADLGLRLDAGALAVHETRTRHQAGRLPGDGVGHEGTGWTFGPFVAPGIAVRLGLVRGWGVVLGGGPMVSWVNVENAGTFRTGWSGELAVSYRL